MDPHLVTNALASEIVVARGGLAVSGASLLHDPLWVDCHAETELSSRHETSSSCDASRHVEFTCCDT